MVIKSTLKLKPVDRVAARVTQKAPRDSVYDIKNRDKLVDSEFWEAPKPHKPLPKNQSFKDLTGVVVGRLSVIGYLGKSSWQCRCVCGRYCARTSKFINQLMNGRESTESLCRECYGVMLLKKKEFYKANGRYPTDKEKMQL